MSGKNFLKKIKFLLLIIVITSCRSLPEPEPIVYIRPASPLIPDVVWIDVDGYYALDENSGDFEALQEFLDKYEGYLEKVRQTFDKYDNIYPEE